MITLTDEEKRKFEMYLRQEAASYKGLVDQMEKLPSGKIMSKPLVANFVALIYVATWLSSGEEQDL